MPRIHYPDYRVNYLTQGKHVRFSPRHVGVEIGALAVVKRLLRDAPLINAYYQGDARNYEGGTSFPERVFGLLLIFVSCVTGCVGLILFFRPDDIFSLDGLTATVLIVCAFFLAQWGLAYWT